MESAAPPQLVFDSWPLLSQWLGQHWPWLCLLGAVALALIFRDWLLEQPAGRLWPVGAAFLPPLIPFAREWDQKVWDPFKGCIVPGLLLAVAVLQLYGQERNNRDRIKTENQFLDLVAKFNDQSIRLNSIAAAVNAIAAEAVKQGQCLQEQSEHIRDIRDIIKQE